MKITFVDTERNKKDLIIGDIKRYHKSLHYHNITTNDGIQARIPIKKWTLLLMDGEDGI